MPTLIAVATLWHQQMGGVRGEYIRDWVVAVRQGGGGNVGDTMFTSYTSGCHGRQAASLLVLILQHPHSAVAMVTSSREIERGRERKSERETKKGRGGRKKQGGERKRQ